MTKQSMINEMLDSLNSKFRNEFYETMIKKNKKQIETVHNEWLKNNKEHTTFYVSLLDR